jgi:hypothetical protein
VDKQPEENNIGYKEIKFVNGNSAKLVTTGEHDLSEEIVEQLNLKDPKSIILNIGGAGNLNEADDFRLINLFSRAVAVATRDNESMIIDGGTDSGVMSLMGMGVVDRGKKTDLIGVAPAGKVSYPGMGESKKGTETFPLEPNHSHFILVNTDNWGSEKETIFNLVKHFTDKSKDLPVLTLLVNGGPLSKYELLSSVRAGYPVLIIEGSGRMADEVAGLWRTRPEKIEDPVMAEIISDGKIHLFNIDNDEDELIRLIHRLLEGNSMLRDAWERFALYDFNAEKHQKTFGWLQSFILLLAVIGTLLAVIQSQIKLTPISAIGKIQLDQENFIAILKYTIIIVPITISILISVVNRFKFGNKWIYLRTAAEEIISEIYRYRTRTSIYSNLRTMDTWRDLKLANKIKAINQRAMQTEINLTGLRPYSGELPPHQYRCAEGDSGLDPLSPDQYIKYRLNEQLNYYQKNTVSLEKRLKIFQWLIYISGGVGTLLAAMDFEIWIAFTTALAGSFTTYLQFKQTENSLVSYNHTAADLSDIRSWWNALSNSEQYKLKNFDRLVALTENIFRRENVGWVQQMQDMLDELHDEQSENEDINYTT